MIAIRYVWHDCFAVYMRDATFVFDYWLGPDGTADVSRLLDSIDASIPLYVLVSHSHKDHYNPDIFAWASRFPRIRYVVSSDVWKRMRHIVSPTSVYKGPRPDPSTVTVLRPGEIFCDDTVRVAAFPSTDTGNSYIADCGGTRIFHAGDLNAWIWLDESSPQEVRKAMGDFHACLRDIRRYIETTPKPDSGADIDFCFFPVDSRIGRDYFTGAAEITIAFNTSRFFPMHFALGDADERRQRRADALRFDLYANRERGEYIPLANPWDLYMCCNQ